MLQLTKSFLKNPAVNRQFNWGVTSIMRRNNLSYQFNPPSPKQQYSSVRDDEHRLLLSASGANRDKMLNANLNSTDNFAHRHDLAQHQFFAMHQPLLGVNRDGSVQQWTSSSVTAAVEADEALANWTEEVSAEMEQDIEAKAEAFETLIEKFANLKTEELDEYLDTVKDFDLINLNPNSPADHPLINRFNGDSQQVADQFFLNIERDLNINREQRPRLHKSYHLSSVLRKRKVKMNKHKYSKLRKRTRALRKRLNK